MPAKKRAKSARKKPRKKTLEYNRQESSQAQLFEEEGTLWHAIKHCTCKKNGAYYSKEILHTFENDDESLRIRDDVGATPLHLICLHKNTKLAKQVINKFPEAANDTYEEGKPMIDEKQNDGYNRYTGENCLHIAIVKEDMELIKTLLKGESERDDESKLVHHEAVGKFFQPKEVVEEREKNSWYNWLFKSEFETEGDLLCNGITCYAGGYPLSFAVMMNNEKIVKLLVKNGADISKKDTINGNTAMHIALYYGLKNMYTLLSELWEKKKIEEGKDSERELFMLENKDKLNALTYAASLGKPDLFKFVWDSVKKEQWVYGRIRCDYYPLYSVDAISRTPPYTGKGCLEIIHEKGHHQMLEIRNLQRLVHVQFNTPTIRNAFLRSKCISYFFLLCVFLCSANMSQGTYIKVCCELLLFGYSLVRTILEACWTIYYSFPFFLRDGKNRDAKNRHSYHFRNRTISPIYKWTHAISIACCLIIGFIPCFAGCWSLSGEDCEVHSNIFNYILDSPNTIFHILNGKNSYFHFKHKEIMVYRKCALAMLNICAWLNALWYNVLSTKKYATFYLAMMRTNIAFFAQITGCFIISFSTIFSALQLDTTSKDHPGRNDTSFLAHTHATTAAMLGDYSRDAYSNVEQVPEWVPQIISFIFMYAFSTIILNMFIGIMGETYNRVSADIDTYWNWEMLGFIQCNGIFDKKYHEWDEGDKYWKRLKMDTDIDNNHKEKLIAEEREKLIAKDRYLEVLDDSD